MRADSHDGHPASYKAPTRRGHAARGLALAALLALALGLLSACGGDGGDDDPAASLSSAATEIADDLNEAAADVGDSGLDDLAERSDRQRTTTGPGQ